MPSVAFCDFLSRHPLAQQLLWKVALFLSVYLKRSSAYMLRWFCKEVFFSFLQRQIDLNVFFFCIYDCSKKLRDIMKSIHFFRKAFQNETVLCLFFHETLALLWNAEGIFGSFKLSDGNPDAWVMHTKKEWSYSSQIPWVMSTSSFDDGRWGLLLVCI